MKQNDKLNLTMLCDFYELTMSNGYFQSGYHDRVCCFDLFFRRVPDGGGFAIAAGLEQVVDYIQKRQFVADDMAYRRSRAIFSEEFLDYLSTFHFSGDLWAVPEGTPVFPGEPILIVRAPAIEAQLLETYLLLEMNHQSLIATKSSRICRAAQGRAVLEFGSRRALGADDAITVARASTIVS
ncbi:MAG: nicotinate phosphoribosyltransferase, partial [Oscillospiraceae bacterium]|nr:nicotinate phosphoribosyltransferase [Oscillospiraceae bacterium]